MSKAQPDFSQTTASIPPELMPGTFVEVVKRNIWEKEIWRYTGWVTEIGKHHVVLEAHFDRNDLLLHGLLLAKGDRFLETYYTDRWYNITRYMLGRMTTLEDGIVILAIPLKSKRILFPILTWRWTCLSFLTDAN